MRRILAGAAALIALLLPATAAGAAVPVGQTFTGTATYYNDAGFGACGTPINAATEMLVAVSWTFWTTANPNADPLCQGVSVQVTYNGQTITVPVKDKCPSCDATHIDLSQAAFGRFASTDPANTPGVLPVTWKFVTTGSGGANQKWNVPA
ncbi:cysteine/serine endopeptidase inhibitor [Actinoplanes sp. HUAS TT8]|uniref:cysteine/serine endopeptidase inhibitor n=1 Tax=Actinoplanes sp. HUAS TT8 TaxID=3447453 RepID=UPI003F5215A8